MVDTFINIQLGGGGRSDSQVTGLAGGSDCWHTIALCAKAH